MRKTTNGIDSGLISLKSLFAFFVGFYCTRIEKFINFDKYFSTNSFVYRLLCILIMNSLRESYYRNDQKSFCEVCGDKARGCNFDAITCASCKEFFRRNAFKEKASFNI